MSTAVTTGHLRLVCALVQVTVSRSAGVLWKLLTLADEDAVTVVAGDKVDNREAQKKLSQRANMANDTRRAILGLQAMKTLVTLMAQTEYCKETEIADHSTETRLTVPLDVSVCACGCIHSLLQAPLDSDRYRKVRTELFESDGLKALVKVVRLSLDQVLSHISISKIWQLAGYSLISALL